MAAARDENIERLVRQEAAARGERWVRPDPSELEPICVNDPERAAQGDWIHGGRMMIRVGADDRILERKILPACVHAFDGELFTLSDDRDTFYLLPSGSRVELEPLEELSVRARTSSDWGILLRDDGELLALRRRDGRVTRGHVADSMDGGEDDDVGPWAAGAWLVSQNERGEIRAEPSRAVAVTVRGCPGVVLDAAASGAGLALHARPVDRNGDRASSSSHLCLVDAGGVTQRVVQLGHATCGLARPMPCSWGLAAENDGVLAFGSMRGQMRFIDARSGRTLAHSTLPGDAALQSCGADFCMDVWNPDGTQVRWRLRPRRAAGRMVVSNAGPTPAPRSARARAPSSPRASAPTPLEGINDSAARAQRENGVEQEYSAARAQRENGVEQEYSAARSAHAAGQDHHRVADRDAGARVLVRVA